MQVNPFHPLFAAELVGATLRPDQIERWHAAVEAWFDAHPEADG